MADEALGADEVARKQFTTGFRGFDQYEVRAFLAQVAAELGALQERDRSLRERLATAEHRATPRQVDEDELETMLGAETTRVLRAAREAAAEIRSRAEEHVARLLREANDEASRLRSDAESILAQRTEEAEAAAATIVQAAEQVAASLQAGAEVRASAVTEEAQQQGREMVNEAQAVRERVLKDLARRRRLAATQLEQLRAGRERLLEAYDVVRSTLEQATNELSVAEAQARLAAEAAGLRPPPDDEEGPTDAEVATPPTGLAAADAVTRPKPASEPEPEPEPRSDVDVAAVSPVRGLPSIPQPSRRPEERRSSSLRLLRRRNESPDLAPSGDEVMEGVRILRSDPDLQPEAPPMRHEVPEAVEDSQDLDALEVAEMDVDTDRAEPAAAETIESPVVEDVFARLRADRAAAVMHAEAVLAEVPRPAPTPEPDVFDVPAEPEGVDPEAIVESAQEPEPSPVGETVFERRDAAVETIERALTKVLKRSLSDEQNVVLDSLRRLRGAPRLEALLPSPDEHRARFAELATEQLAAAALAGRGESSDGSLAVAPVAAALGADVADEIRVRLGRAIEATSGDEEALLEGISGVYREWKTVRSEGAARHHVAAAYALGAFRAAPDGDLCWVVDPAEGGCPDCDDNALAGPTAKGATYPTGQVHPPAHAGCRCLVLPAPAAGS